MYSTWGALPILFGIAVGLYGMARHSSDNNLDTLYTYLATVFFCVGVIAIHVVSLICYLDQRQEELASRMASDAERIRTLEATITALSNGSKPKH